MEISEYQDRAAETDRSSTEPWIGLGQNVFGLAKKFGSLAGCLKKQIRDGAAYQDFRDDVRRCLGETFWYLASVASHFGVSLDDVARENLARNADQWGRPDHGQREFAFSHLFDDEYPPDQQLPRQFTARFVFIDDSQKSWLPMVKVWIDGQPFGDAIDDNVPREDFYRLHDVIHIGYAAVLGWSPVIRRLLKRKRKENAEVDKYEDGARACDREEAVTSLIHAEAKRTNYFDGVHALDSIFLLEVQSVIAGLEVQARPRVDWQRCILESYRMFRLLRDNRGGYVDASLIDRTLTFRPPEPGA